MRVGSFSHLGTLQSVEIALDAYLTNGVASHGSDAYLLVVLVTDPEGRSVQIGGYEFMAEMDNSFCRTWPETWIGKESGGEQWVAVRQVSAAGLTGGGKLPGGEVGGSGEGGGDGGEGASSGGREFENSIEEALLERRRRKLATPSAMGTRTRTAGNDDNDGNDRYADTATDGNNRLAGGLDSTVEDGYSEDQQGMWTVDVALGYSLGPRASAEYSGDVILTFYNAPSNGLYFDSDGNSSVGDAHQVLPFQSLRPTTAPAFSTPTSNTDDSAARQEPSSTDDDDDNVFVGRHLITSQKTILLIFVIMAVMAVAFCILCWEDPRAATNALYQRRTYQYSYIPTDVPNMTIEEAVNERSTVHLPPVGGVPLGVASSSSSGFGSSDFGSGSHYIPSRSSRARTHSGGISRGGVGYAVLTDEFLAEADAARYALEKAAKAVEDEEKLEQELERLERSRTNSAGVAFYGEHYGTGSGSAGAGSYSAGGSLGVAAGSAGAATGSGSYSFATGSLRDFYSTDTNPSVSGSSMTGGRGGHNTFGVQRSHSGSESAGVAVGSNSISRSGFPPMTSNQYVQPRNPEDNDTLYFRRSPKTGGRLEPSNYGSTNDR